MRCRRDRVSSVGRRHCHTEREGVKDQIGEPRRTFPGIAMTGGFRIFHLLVNKACRIEHRHSIDDSHRYSTTYISTTMILNAHDDSHARQLGCERILLASIRA